MQVVEKMITDILALANPAFRYRGGGGKRTSLTEAAVAEDCASYVLLNDAVVEQIYTSVQPGLVRSSTSNAPQPIGEHSAPPRSALPLSRHRRHS